MVSTRNIRLLLLLLVLPVTLGIITKIVSRSRSEQIKSDQIPQQTLPNNVDIALHNARFTEIRGSAVVWELVATDAVYSKNGELATLQDITMNFSATRNAGKCTVTARKGTYSNKTRNVELHGSVHIETENGAYFDTETLHYRATRSIFTTKDVIKFNHDRLTLTAKGMELDVGQQKVRFFDKIDAIVSGINKQF